MALYYHKAPYTGSLQAADVRIQGTCIYSRKKGLIMVDFRPTLTESEVKAFLVEDGYKVRTSAYRDELRRRYEPVEGTKGQFYERHDWLGDRQKCPTS